MNDPLKGLREVKTIIHPRVTDPIGVSARIEEWLTHPEGRFRDTNLWDALGWTSKEYVMYVKTGKLPNGEDHED